MSINVGRPETPKHDELFPTTRWTIVLSAGLGTPAAEQAMIAFLERYRPVLERYLRRSTRASAEAAEEIVSGFLTDRVVLGDLLARADRQRGHLRQLLRVALRNYQRDVLRRQAAGTRAAERLRDVLSVGQTHAADDHAMVYDVEWARQLVATALERMETECRVTGSLRIWRVFAARVVDPILRGHQPVPYDRLAGELAFEGPAQAGNALTTGKRMFRRILGALVLEYVQTQEEADEEIRHLFEVLSRGRA